MTPKILVELKVLCMREDIIISKKDQGVYKIYIGLKREITSVHPPGWEKKKNYIMFLMQYRTVKAFSLKICCT